MVSVNTNLIKECFNLYENKSLYNNYSKISQKYYKLYKDKKSSADNQDKLKEDVKKWLFGQSLENRMKICTVENEFYGKSLYQMLLYVKMDKAMVFKAKSNFFNTEEDNNNEFTQTNNAKTEDIYPPNNTNIKVTRTNKSGKKTEAPKLGYSQSSLKEFTDEELKQITFNNYFTFQSYRGNYSLTLNNDKNNKEQQKIIEICTEELFNNIIFFSVHHRYFPDCFTLSPEFLLEKDKFDNCFKNLGNSNCFSSLIESKIVYGNNKSQKQYCYMLPEWFKNKINNNNNDECCYYSVTQYVIAFFEQVIMIKYLLNKNDKKLKAFSLLDDLALNRFFTERKYAINYMKKNYNNETRINIINELEIEKYYKNIIINREKMKYYNYVQNLFRKINIDDKSKISPYLSIINNPYSNKHEEKFNKMKNIQKQKYNKNNNNLSDLSLEQITNKIKNIINTEDNIYFIDYLLFQNYIVIWKIEYFLQAELFEKLANLITEQNCKELIQFDSSKQTKSKNRHRKKNKKNNNNNNIQQIQKEEEKNNNNKIQNEYDGIFKDEEEELYAPYYLRANTEQKKLYQKLKGINVADINEKANIKQFIANEIILGIIIDNVFLTPLNSGLDFYKELKDDIYINKFNDNKIEKEEEKISEKEDKKEIILENENEQSNKLNNNKMEEEKEVKEEKEGKENLNIIKENSINSNSNLDNNSINKNIDINSNNNIDNISNSNEIIINSNSKEIDFEKSDSLSLQSENFSSKIDKITNTTANTNYANEVNYVNNEGNIKKNDEIENNIKNNSKPKKKKEKEQTFFLFDTVKKKKKKNTHNSNNNALISNEFNIITIKESNRRLSFFDKLHNDIIKYETKVITLLNHGMKFKDYCIKEIKRIIQETFTFSKDYNVDVYGSYATGLMIEASDIDIKIKLNNGNKNDLDNFFETLSKKLENEKKFDKINPIGTASVPVIKLLLSPEKFIKGKDDLENSFKQFKELSLFKHYIFDINELTKIKIDVTFILAKNSSNEINEKNIDNETNNNKNKFNLNNEIAHDHDKSIGGEISSVSYVKEQILKYPEIKFILRVLKRYFYYKKMNTSFLGGLSSYNLFLLLLSYAKFLHISPNHDSEMEEYSHINNKINTNLGFFLFNFLYFFKCLNFKQCIIDINSPNIYDIYDLVIPEKAKEFNYGKSIVIIDPLTGVNASKSSYKIEEIQETFSQAFDFFQGEKIKYDKEGKTKVFKNNNNKEVLMGLPISNKNENNHGGGGGNIIEKFLGK